MRLYINTYAVFNLCIGLNFFRLDGENTMFQSIEIILGVYKTKFWIAQLPVEQGVSTPEEAALVFSGPQFLVALLAGVMMAFAFQLLLTNFSVAAYVASGESSSETDSSESLGSAIGKIETKVGLWTLVTVDIHC